jgi:anti-sigma factor RsiW
MCEYSGKLMAWLDRELGDDEMADVQGHIRECMECQSRVKKYEQVSETFDAYCDALMGVKVRRRMPRWVPALAAAAAIAIAVTLGLTLPRRRAERQAIPPFAASAPAAVILEPTLQSTAEPIKPIRRRHAAPRVQAPTAHWVPAEPAIEIAIPAESMFPPGAFPEGVNFTADVSFAPDGSAEQVRLRPRLIGFQRRGTQP